MFGNLRPGPAEAFHLINVDFFSLPGDKLFLSASGTPPKKNQLFFSNMPVQVHQKSMTLSSLFFLFGKHFLNLCLSFGIRSSNCKQKISKENTLIIVCSPENSFNVIKSC